VSQIRFSVSALGKYLEPKIEKFLKDNIDYMKKQNSATYEDGNEMVANAISYGIALALSSPIMQSAFAAGIAPPPVPPSSVTAGGPVGQWMYSVLKPNVIET